MAVVWQKEKETFDKRIKTYEIRLYLKGDLKKALWKYAANLEENTHAEVWFQ